MMSKARQRVALFGGSFDPVHVGHVAVARAAVAQAGLDRVIFLPARQSPLKERGPEASGEWRAAMLRAALGGEEWAEVSDWELGRPGPSYSWETAAHYRQVGGESWELYWLMGADQWEELERWVRWEELAGTVIFLVFGREGRELRKREGVRAVFLEGTFGGSSTEVRAACRSGGGWRDLVDARVAEVMERAGLYGLGGRGSA